MPRSFCAYLVIWLRTNQTASVTCAVLDSASAAPEPPGYQCRITKSTEGPAIDSTTWFQVPASPPATMPSGQLPGVVSTAPILTVGSTAFMAWANCLTFSAYAAGLLS